MRSVESQDRLIDIPGAQQTLRNRVSANPLPRELRQLRKTWSVYGPE